ncbi:MAG: family 20 glycosylhydrolase, partial [Pseudomonadota bacterium]
MMHYECQIVDNALRCTIVADQDLTAPVFCFSGMAPMAPTSGGVLLKSVGSYTEVQLPDLGAGHSHKIEIVYQNGYAPANRAWMPLGPYLRHQGEVITLPQTPAGRSVPQGGAVVEVDGLALIPQPNAWAPTGGSLQADGFAAIDPALAEVANLADRQGMVFRGGCDVVIETADLPEDAYEIEIAAQSVTIRASNYGGRFYAGITLLTLLQHGPIPCGQISDAPRFGWRGQHLDTARHYYAAETIFALLDLMAMMKMNRFHWHFADDEAFRLEITCLPELWQATALRGEGQLMPGLFTGAPVQGGSYSIETAKDIIAYAKRLNIEVMPEIETPAHALCLTTLYPDTLDADDTGTSKSVQGYEMNVLNPAMPKTWEVLEAIAEEVGALFPFGHLHLGCDELPNGTWLQSPKARALMDAHGLKTTQDLQGWTIAKLAGFVAGRGIRPAA